MCDVTQEDRLDEIFERRRAEAEALWGKKLTIPQEPPRWPPRHDVLNWKIGQRIRARRSWGYVFQDQLARAIGISQSALSRMEWGLREIGVVELVRIATLLETTPEALLHEPAREEDDDVF
jgi:transcriptional regulator with XRE-family HTH domain